MLSPMSMLMVMPVLGTDSVCSMASRTWGQPVAVVVKFGNWSAAFYGTAALTLVSALLILVLRFMPLPSLRREEDPMLVTAKAG